MLLGLQQLKSPLDYQSLVYGRYWYLQWTDSHLLKLVLKPECLRLIQLKKDIIYVINVKYLCLRACLIESQFFICISHPVVPHNPWCCQRWRLVRCMACAGGWFGRACWGRQCRSPCWLICCTLPHCTFTASTSMPPGRSWGTLAYIRYVSYE